jgi:hypothetical protein
MQLLQRAERNTAYSGQKSPDSDNIVDASNSSFALSLVLKPANL